MARICPVARLRGGQSVATSPELPEDWQAVTDEASSKTYYWNTATGETTWDPPTTSKATEGLETGANSPLVLDTDPEAAVVASSATLGLQRKFWWATGDEPPPRVPVSEQDDMVMLQGFNWKMASDRRALYTQLAAEMAPLAAAGVKTVWFPPPSESADEQGYLPGRWYVIGNRTLLDAAISAAHAHGIVTMADVVLNHRAAIRISPNSSWWTEFEGPDWGEWAIVANDWKCHPEEHLKVCPDNCTCGAPDTGENACYAPDVDHTNPRINADVVEWLRWLQAEVGFDAFRFDNTKGYAGKFTNYYISQTAPMYTVSEFYDSNRALISGWLDSSGRSSTVFDFGLRYKLKESVKWDDFSLLRDEWMGPMLWYDQELAVTFTDNHDTAGDHHFAISDHFGSTHQIAAGYAFILTHPSRPCIFWQDWMGENREVIKELLAIRKRADLSPRSAWNLMEARRGLYAAYVDASAGGAGIAIKVGHDEWSPNDGLESLEWRLAASGKVQDVQHLPPVDERVVPAGHLLLLDESFDCEGQDGGMIKARITAFAPPPPRDFVAGIPGEPVNITIRAFAADPGWPWPAANDTGKFRIRPGLVMHWAVARQTSAEWGRPGDEMLPPFPFESHRDGDAVQTVFEQGSEPCSGDRLDIGWDELQPHVSEIRLAIPAGVKGLNFVLMHRKRAHDGEDSWYRTDGDMHRPPSDFYIRMPSANPHGPTGPYWAVWERSEVARQDAAGAQAGLGTGIAQPMGTY